MHIKRHEEKFQKKNKQLVEIIDTTQNEESKEISFEDSNIKSFMNNPPEVGNKSSAGSPFKLEQRKRVRTSDSQEEMIFIQDDKEFSDFKVNLTHNF